jgi:Response regulator containing CheY-like receiver, AAA-type ATPase, and DNA-binding domains
MKQRTASLLHGRRGTGAMPGGNEMSHVAPSVLVVSPLEVERRACSAWLREDGMRVFEACNGSEALGCHRERTIAVTFSDLDLGELDGVELLYRIRALNADAAVALFTDRDRADVAVAALKAGASDVLVKPLDRQRLLTAARNATDYVGSAEDLGQRIRALYAKHDFSGIVCRSAPMLKVLELAARIAVQDCTVLITGASGTGKEVIARAIHANSRRSKSPFVCVNCAAIPEALLESELFGYRRGAFTGAVGDKPGLLAVAGDGTILLDEVAELSQSMQAKLLQALQNRTYYPVGSTRPVEARARIIAATNADLDTLVEQGAFREDLYYRLCVFPLHVPPLCDRREDIVPLARYFLSRLEGQVGKRVPGLSREAAAYLTRLPWPGNVRQLQNAIEYAVIISDGSLLTSKDFPIREAATIPEDLGAETRHVWRLPEGGIDLDSLVRSLTQQALERTGHRVSAAARLLGLSRATLRYRMKKYGLVGAGRGAEV